MRISRQGRFPKKPLLNKKEYTKYREQVDEKFRIKGRDSWMKFVREYYNVITDLALQYEGGVCVEKYYYLFFFMLPEKRVLKRFVDGNKYRKIYNYHSDMYIYTPTISFTKSHYHWSFSNVSSSDKLRNGLKDLLFAKEKPKNHYTVLKINKKV